MSIVHRISAHTLAEIRNIPLAISSESIAKGYGLPVALVAKHRGKPKNPKGKPPSVEQTLETSGQVELARVTGMSDMKQRSEVFLARLKAAHPERFAA